VEYNEKIHSLYAVLPTDTKHWKSQLTAGTLFLVANLNLEVIYPN
jgi:hypothetical protein